MASGADAVTVAGDVVPAPRARRRIAAAVAAVSASAGLAVALQAPDFSRFNVVPVLLVCLGTVAFAVAAVMLAGERGQWPNARLFALTGVLFAMEWAFTWPATPIPFLALPTGQWFAVGLAVLLLRYPNTRLARPEERWLVRAGIGFTLVGRLLVELTSKPEWFAFGIGRGHGQLPASTVWSTLDANLSLSHSIAVVTDVGQLLIAGLFMVVIVRRLRRDSSIVRTELTPVVVGVLVLSGVLVVHLIALLTIAYHPAAAPSQWVAAALSLAVLLIPLAFVITALRRRLAQGSIADLVVRLSRPATGAEVEAALQDAVNDRSLRVRYWLPEAATFVDTSDHPVGEAVAQDGETVVPVRDRNGKLLAVVHADPAHQRNMRVLSAAVAAATLALENTRLEAALRAQLEEVRASRGRLFDTALTERRRIERDLHDGAQQQLLAIGATLGRLDLRADIGDGSRELIDDLRAQVRRTREELRSLARGLHPAVLTESGLSAAVSAAAQRLPVSVDLDIPPTRWAPNVELTAYFVACEALTNCVTHASGAHASIVARHDTGRVVLTVSDDGGGGASFVAGGGLAGLRDRVSAMGGDLTMSSGPGRGTRIRAVLPCA